jgi:2-isopropylmalate synthase
VDLVTLALNLQYLGVDTGLDFHDLESIRDTIVGLTDMPVHARHPYAGELVFAAFSGSHQDAIHKGLNRIDDLRAHFGGWKIPYLHIDPSDLGREYERFIRINSQSGKGGIAHVLQSEYGVQLPRPLLIELSRYVQAYADETAREIRADEVWDIFRREFVRQDGPIRLINYWPRPNREDPGIIEGEVHLEFDGRSHVLHGTAVGPIAAFAKALRTLELPEFVLKEFEEDAIGTTADAEAITFVKLEKVGDGAYYGVGFGANIDQAAIRAFVSSLNRMLAADRGL